MWFSALEWWSVMYIIGIHMRPHRFNTAITGVIAACKVLLGVKTLKRL